MIRALTNNDKEETSGKRPKYVHPPTVQAQEGEEVEADKLG